MCGIYIERESETDRKRQTYRAIKTDRDRYRERQRVAEIKRQRDRQIYIKTDRDRVRERERRKDYK